MMLGDHFLVAKAWALLHDPPHKAWHLTNRAKCFREGHEEEARAIWSEVVRGTGLDGLLDDRSMDVVRRADRLAAGLDRWLLMKRPGYHDYLNLINPFNPRQVHANPPRISCESVKRFVKRLERLLKPCRTPMECYKLLYLGAELAWAAEGLPLGPADTRLPTHSIFDHLYATAAMVNWSLDERPAGYLVYLDIPSIQRVVTGARKASDYWAGSWLVSKVMWDLVSEVVEEVGPDALLLPTARLNPFYVWGVLREVGDKARRELDGLLKDSLVRNYVPLLGDKAPPIPVMPGTASLVLPPGSESRLGGRLDKYFRGRLESVWGSLVDGLSNELRRDGDPVKSAVGRLIEKHRRELSEPQVSLRLVAVKVDDVYDVLTKIYQGEEVSGARLFSEDLDRLKEAIDELKKMDVAEDGVKTLLLYAVLGPWLKRLLFENKVKTILAPPKWQIDLTEQRFASGEGWDYCGACGEEPALFKLGRRRDPSTRALEDEYDDEAVKLLKSVGLGELDGLKPVLKPGEALGALCLIKRGLSLLYSDELGVARGTPFRSNESVALSVIHSLVRDKLKEALRRLDECSSAELVFSRDGEVDYDLITSAIRKSLEGLKNDVSRCFRRMWEDDEYKGLVNSVAEEYYSRISEGLGVKPEPGAVMDLMGVRVYYSILVGDADYVGRLLRGDLGLSVGEYVGMVIKEAGLRGDNREVLQRSSKVVEKLGGLTVLPSPSYLSSVSKALMITALKDVAIIRGGLGLPVYNGGDDVAALLPVETSLQVLRQLRSNYWGKDGFHELGKLVSPALTAYGRSFSLRLAHVMDPMKYEIERARDLLEEEAKEKKWDNHSKDSVVISRSRVGDVAVLPIRNPRVVDELRKLWVYSISKKLSTSLPEDYDKLREASGHLWSDVIRYVVERNVREDVLAGEITRFLSSRDVGENLIKAFKVWRVMPE